jgi:catechol 2,3-dioxygenase-like lactoylglutathione lyase family enzyme
MPKLDHLGIFVQDVRRSREWYTKNLGLKVEFDIPHMKAVALQDEAGFTIFIGERAGGQITPSCVLTGRSYWTLMDILSACGMNNPCGKRVAREADRY